MARKKKQKQRKAQKHDAKSNLSKALIALEQGNLAAVEYQVAQAKKFARTSEEQTQSEQLFDEITFRYALKETSSDKKLAALAGLVKRTPDDARLQFYYGITLLQVGDFKNAQKAFEIVAKTEPSREGLVFFHQLAILAQKKLPDRSAPLSEAEANTISVLQKLQRQPSPQLARTNVMEPVLGTAQLWTSLLSLRHDKASTQSPAVGHLGQAQTRPMATAVLKTFRGTAAMRGDDQEAAMQAWQEAMLLGLNDNWLHKNLGLSTRREAQKLAAAGQWQALVKMGKRLPPALNDTLVMKLLSLASFHTGFAHTQEENWEQALSDWKYASNISHNRYLAQNMALAHEHLKQFTAAANAWREMLKRRPRKKDHPEYLNDKHVSAIWAHVADCYFQDWNDSEAITCFQKAITYDPKNMTARFRLVAMYQDREIINLDGAMRELNAILEIEPNNIEALTQLATLYSNDWRYSANPLWKRIFALEPDNVEAREALVSSYINQVFPPMLQHAFGEENFRMPPINNPSVYKQRLSLLNEALELLPNHPRLLSTLGSIHQQGGKKTLARDAFLRAYELTPDDPGVASGILQNLALMNDADAFEKLIPKVHKIPDLLAEFWVDQGVNIIDRVQWAERFFEEAVRHVEYSPHCSLASVLVDIYMTLDKEGQRGASLKERYMEKIQAEVPESGAVEYIDGFTHYQRTGNVKRARRQLQKARELALAAHEIVLVKVIQSAEAMLSPSKDAFLNTLLNGIDDGMLEQFIDEMGGFR